MKIYSAKKSLKNLLIQILTFYKLAISPYISSQCSFSETCSEYSKRSIFEKGIIIGGLFTFIRLILCTFYPLLSLLRKIKIKAIYFFSPLILFLFVSCMSFSYEGGWSDIVYLEEDDSYFVTTNQGRLHKFNISDGIPNTQWSYPKESKNTSYSNPIFHENSVISSNFSCRGKSCEGEIFQLDINSGALEWNINTLSKISSKMAINKDILAYSTLKKQTEVSNDKEAEIHFISLADKNYENLGKITLEGEIWTGVELFEEKFVVSTLDGWIYVLDANIDKTEKINVENLIVDSKKYPFSINSPISFYDDNLYFSDVSGTFYSANINNLDESISSNIENWMISSPIFHNNSIYIFTVNGDLLILDQSNLRLINKYNTEKIIVGDPKLHSYDGGEYIFIPTEKKGIEVLSNSNVDFAESLGNYPTDKKIYSSPLVHKDNLLIHSQKGEVLFFRLKSRDLFYCLNLNEGKICD